MYMWGGAIHTV